MMWWCRPHLLPRKCCSVLTSSWHTNTPQLVVLALRPHATSSDAAARPATPFVRKVDADEDRISKTRNVGIVAHIDAGKTTTTERMLFYAGVTKRVGDVDSGTTTTDYMPQEAERGITITAAAVSMEWKGVSINLIDTPGHADFNVEVERSLRVVDGVVALFDASAGVQAQSYAVLRQARKFRVPVVAFLNKMDKPNASFAKSVASIRDKLSVEPLVLQLPLHAEDGAFEGVIDLVDLTVLRFGGPSGREVQSSPVASSLPEHQVVASRQARHELLSTLSARDDEVSEALITALDQTDGDEDKAEALLRSDVIHRAIRRLVCRSTARREEEADDDDEHDHKHRNAERPLVPVLCGASRRDQGVQPLLDAVCAYLPSPLDRAHLLSGFASDGTVVPLPPPSSQSHLPTLALAFKVIHARSDKGSVDPLVFFRVYSGKVLPRVALQNRTRRPYKTEQPAKLYVMHANEPREVPCIAAGGIGAAFLSHSWTGDTLYADPIHTRLYSQTRAGNHDDDGGSGEDSAAPQKLVHTLEGIHVPPPAISFAIEAANSRQVAMLEDALTTLQREDPSIRFQRNEFGQLILQGMGELHLEIVLSRLEREFDLSCKLLRAIIEYREVLVSCPLERSQRSGSHGDPLLSTIVLRVKDVPAVEMDVEWHPVASMDASTLAASVEDDGDFAKEEKVTELPEPYCRDGELEVDFAPECEEALLASTASPGGRNDDGEGPQRRSRGGTGSSSSSSRHRADARGNLALLAGALKNAWGDIHRMGLIANVPILGVRLVVRRVKLLVPHLDEKQLSVAARVALKQALSELPQSCFALMEPMMHVEVHLTEATYLGEVMNSLNAKHATTVDMLEDGRSVSGVAPMRNLVRFTTDLRKAAKGNANFFMRLSHYRLLEDKAVLSRVLKNLGAVV